MSEDDWYSQTGPGGAFPNLRAADALDRAELDRARTAGDDYELPEPDEETLDYWRRMEKIIPEYRFYHPKEAS